MMLWLEVQEVKPMLKELTEIEKNLIKTFKCRNDFQFKISMGRCIKS